MHISRSVSSLLLSVGLVEALPAATPDTVDQLATDGVSKLTTYKQTNPGTTGCTIETAVQRKEW